MSKHVEGDAGRRDRWHSIRQDTKRKWARFRKSRLFTQVWLSTALVICSVVVARVDWAPLQQVRAPLARVVQEDYDFVGQARAAHYWVQQRGGYASVAARALEQGKGKIGRWLEPLGALRGAGSHLDGARLPGMGGRPL